MTLFHSVLVVCDRSVGESVPLAGLRLLDCACWIALAGLRNPIGQQIAAVGSWRTAKIRGLWVVLRRRWLR